MITRLEQEFPGQLAMTFIHFPLENHRFALPAAKALECAGQQGRFREYLDLSFAKQDSLGLKSWASYASDAQVPNDVRFESCVADSILPTPIVRGRNLGKSMDMNGTPTVVLNGLRYSVPPPESLIRALLSDAGSH